MLRLPALVRPTLTVALLTGVAVAFTGIIAFVVGYAVFRSRVKGAYFSIVTQALALIETEPDLKYRKKYAGVWK